MPGKKSNVFTYMGVDFFPNSCFRDLQQIEQLHYDYCILDYGVLFSGSFPEYVRASSKIAVSTVSEWNFNKCYSFIMSMQKQIIDQKHFLFLGNLGPPKQIRTLKQRTDGNVMSFPYLKDPFQLTSDQWGIFKELLGKL